MVAPWVLRAPLAPGRSGDGSLLVNYMSCLLRLSRCFIKHRVLQQANASRLCVLRMHLSAFLYTPALLLFFPTFTTSRSFLHHGHLSHVTEAQQRGVRLSFTEHHCVSRT